MSSPQRISQAYQPGQSVVSFIYDMSVDKVWNTSTLLWETYDASHVANYQTTLTDPNAVGWYSAALPTQMIGMTVQVVSYNAVDLTNPIGTVEISSPDTGTVAIRPGNPQPITQAYSFGRPVVALIYDMTLDFVWNNSTLGYEAYDVANLANYQLAMTDPNNVGWYRVDIPVLLRGTSFQFTVYDTANPNNPIGAGEMSIPDTVGGALNTLDPVLLAVINKALLFLGVGVITNLTDDSEQAERVNQIYAGVLDATLRSHYWKFATFVDNLTLVPDETTPGWEYLYVYPTQCLKIRRIFDPAFVDPTLFGVGFVSFTFDGDFVAYYDLYKDLLYRFKIVISPTTFTKSIAAHVSSAAIEYTYRVTDASMWDQYFADAISWNLAAQLARTLTGNTDLAAQAMQMFNAVVGEAKRLDSEEDRNTHQRMSQYQRARM